MIGALGPLAVESKGHWTLISWCPPSPRLVLTLLFSSQLSAPVAVVGFAALAFGGYQVWILRNLKAEVDQFSKENARLEETEERLEGQVGVLQVR